MLFCAFSTFFMKSMKKVEKAPKSKQGVFLMLVYPSLWFNTVSGSHDGATSAFTSESRLYSLLGTRKLCNIDIGFTLVLQNFRNTPAPYPKT